LIHQDCVDRIMAFGDNESIRQGLVDLANACSNDAEQRGLPSATFVISFYDADCSIEPGDWAAELHIVTRKVSDESADSSSEE